MMTGMRDDVHSSIAIASLTHPLNGLLATFGVHPVMVTIYRKAVRTSETSAMGYILTNEGDGYLQLVHPVY